MSKEIEYKFTVIDSSYRQIASYKTYYRQGYIPTVNGMTVRVRIAGSKGYVTFKDHAIGMTRHEFEYEVPVADAEQMLDLMCDRHQIQKYRYVIPYDHTGTQLHWEVDEFLGDNEGLVVAELEVPSEDYPIELPSWIGKNVTGDHRYYNTSLARYPFKDWIWSPMAKINIGLNVVRKRPEDGYHILQTLFYPIDWRDELEVTPQPSNDASQLCTFTATGIQIDGDPMNNLCVKAYNLLRERFPKLPAVSIHLDKQIPFGAGLGGGSSDGTHTLLALRKLFNLDISDDELEALAARMGADCAFFIRQGAQYCEGIGHELTPYPISLKGYHIVVVKPPFGVSTREAYSGVKPVQPATPLFEYLKLPITEWRNYIHNDFEDSVFPLHPELQQVKDTLYDHGALYASMSGSGSAMFGIFATSQSDCQSWFDPSYIARSTQAMY